MEEFPIPAIGAEDALLRVEACGLCGRRRAVRRSACRIGIPFSPILATNLSGTDRKDRRGSIAPWDVSLRGPRGFVEPLLVVA